MLTDCVEDSSVAMCQNAKAAAQIHVQMKRNGSQHTLDQSILRVSLVLIILQALVMTNYLHLSDEGGETAKKLHTKFKIEMSQLVVQIYKHSHTALRTRASCESQLRSPVHRFTGKSELESTRKWTTVRSPRVTCCSWRNAF